MKIKASRRLMKMNAAQPGRRSPERASAKRARRASSSRMVPVSSHVAELRDAAYKRAAKIAGELARMTEELDAIPDPPWGVGQEPPERPPERHNRKRAAYDAAIENEARRSELYALMAQTSMEMRRANERLRRLGVSPPAVGVV